MTTPAVSVCIRTLDRPVTLRAAVASVLTQDHDDLELIVSSDGGMLDDLVRDVRDPRLRVVVNPGPRGATGNLTHAFGLARGEWLALLDDDDTWRPQFLSTMLAAFEDDPAVGVTFCDYEMAAGSAVVTRPWPWATGRQDDVAERLLDRSIPPAAALIRRTVWTQGERVMPIRPDMAGAASVWLRAAVQGWGFRHVDQTLVRYGLHADQMSWRGDTAARRYATTLRGLRFPTAAGERLRRARLTEAHCTLAGTHLRSGRLRQAVTELRRARAAGGRAGIRAVLAVSGVRGAAARRLVTYPRATRRLVPVWERLRPPPG